MLSLTVFFIYLLLAVILTYPLAFHLNSFVTNPIDPLYYAFNLQHNLAHFKNGLAGILDTNMFYPETNTLAYSDHLFGQSLLLLPFSFLTRNILLLQNIYILSTFALAGFGTYLLVSYLIDNRRAAFLSGVVFAFSLYHFDHLGQVPTTSIQWLPFCFLWLFKSFDKPHRRNFLLFWLFFTLNFLATIYYGLFFLLVLAIFSLFKVRKQFRVVLKFYLWSLPFAVLILITSFPYLLFRLENPDFRRTIDEASWRAANLGDYLRRSPLVHDRALFPGFTAFFLTICSLFVTRKKFIQFFFLILAPLLILLSLGPYRWGLTLPYYYLYKFFPLMEIIRVPARIGILVVLVFAILAGYGFKTLARRLSKVSGNLLFALGLVLVVAESWHLPLNYVKIPTAAEIPPVYHWLAAQPGDFAILELPLRSGRNSNPIEKQVTKKYSEITANDNFVAESYRLYFSTFHNKKMINGYSSYFPPSYSRTAEVMENFPTKEAVQLIRDRKIKYLLINTEQYGNLWPEIETKLREFEEVVLVEEIGIHRIYSILQI